MVEEMRHRKRLRLSAGDQLEKDARAALVVGSDGKPQRKLLDEFPAAWVPRASIPPSGNQL
jgi:hypothetical protein